MKARLLRVSFKPDRYSQAREIIESGLAPALKRQPGFVRGAMLVDRATGGAISIVIWDSETSLSTWESSDTLRTQLDRLLPTVNAQPTREIYDLAYRIPIEGNPTHARSIESVIKPGAEGTLRAAYEQVVEQSLKNQPGFQAALLLVDPAARRGISITAWDNEAALRANDASGAVGANLARVADHFEGPPVIRSWSLVPLR